MQKPWARRARRALARGAPRARACAAGAALLLLAWAALRRGGGARGVALAHVPREEAHAPDAPDAVVVLVRGGVERAAGEAVLRDVAAAEYGGREVGLVVLGGGAVAWPHGRVEVRNASVGRWAEVLDFWVPGGGWARPVLVDAGAVGAAGLGAGWFEEVVARGRVAGADIAGVAGGAAPLGLRGAVAFAGVGDGVAVFWPAADAWVEFRAWFLARRAEWFLWPAVFKPSGKKDAAWGRFRADVRAGWGLWFTRFCAEYGLYVSYGEGAVARYDARGRPAARAALLPADALDRVARLAAEGDGSVALTVVSAAFADTARSWVCNVDVAGLRPRGVVWIATDAAARDALADVPDSEVLYLPQMQGGSADAGTQYGSAGYWLLMVERTRLIRDLLLRGVAVFAFETDQVWLADPVPHVRRLARGGELVDVVGTLDTNHEIAGNFLYLAPTLATRRLWREVSARFDAAYDAAGLARRTGRDARRWRYIENDQSILTKLVFYDAGFRAAGPPPVFRALDVDLFVDGRWYGEGKGAADAYTAARARAPVLVNNNFVVGIDAKRERAARHGHWFLKDGACDRAAVENALRENDERRREAPRGDAAHDVEVGLADALAAGYTLA